MRPLVLSSVILLALAFAFVAGVAGGQFLFVK
jgi:hypothetical protein